MKKLFSILVSAMCLCCFAMSGQGENSALTYYAYVTNTDEELTAEVKEALRSRLDQVILKHAIGSTDLTRFILECRVTVLDQFPMTGYPATYQVKGTFDFTIVDIVERIKFAGTSVSFDARGDNYNHALKKSIAAIDPNEESLTDLFAKCNIEIIAYYLSHCPQQLELAESKLGTYQFDEAIFILLSISELSPECSQTAKARATEVYRAKENHECSTKLNKAKMEWQTGQDLNTAERIGDSLATINPDASCVKEVEAFVEIVAAEVKRQHDRNWDFKYTRDIVNEQQRIESTRQIGIAYGKNQASAIYTTSK